MSADEFAKIVEISSGKEVVSHLLKLSAGLDSLVIGENQILGQIKRAFDISRNKHCIGPKLSVIFDKVFKVGSRVRSTTGINKGSLSIGSMAVSLAEENLDNLHDKKILLIGSGEGASLVAKALRRRSINKFQVTSRTFDRAMSFAATIAGGEPITFDNALESLYDIDLIFVSTIAQYFLVTHSRIEAAMKNREKAMMILDLSNPRTVEESVAGIGKVKLVNLDQISEIVEKNIRSRKKEILSAEKIESEMTSVDKLLRRKKVEPLIVSVFKNVDMIRKRELYKTLSVLRNGINSAERRVIELSHALVEGMLAAPMNNIRREIDVDGKDQEELLRLLAKLFKYEQQQL
jgi:glutamyl-tRNA reductase